MAAEDAADRLRVVRLDRGDVQAQLEPGPAPRHPDDLVAEDLLGQLPRRRRRSRWRSRSRGAGGRRARRRPARASRCRSTAPRRPCRAGSSRTPRPSRPRARRPGRRRPAPAAGPAGARPARLGQRAQVAAGALHPEQLDILAGHRVGLGALGRGVAAGVVGVLRVRAEPVRPVDQLASLRGWSSVVSCPRRNGRGGVGCAVRRPSRPGCRRRARSRSAAGSRTRRTPRIGSPGRPRDSRQAARSGRTSV